MAFDNIHGLPDTRQDAAFARLMSILANIFRGKGAKAQSPTDFLPPSPFEQFESEIMTENERIAGGEHLIALFTEAFGLKEPPKG